MAKKHNALDNKVTQAELEAFVARCQAIVDAHYEKNFPTQQTILVIEAGQKYARIVSVYGMKPVDVTDRTASRSAWAFVDLTNGDVLKSDSWKRPAKHARGNIYDDKGGVGSIGPYGPAYLK